MNHCGHWIFMIYLINSLFIPHSRAGNPRLVTRINDTKQIFELSFCSFFDDDSRLNYSCHEQSTKLTETDQELNAFEVTEHLCGNYSKLSQEEGCKKVQLIFLYLQIDALCIASSSVTLMQPTVTLQLNHRLYFPNCIKPHNKSESQYHEYAFDCTLNLNQTRESITLQINIVDNYACEIPSTSSNHKNLETAEKENRDVLFKMLSIIGGIALLIIPILVIIIVICGRLNLLKKKKLLKGSEKEDKRLKVVTHNPVSLSEEKASHKHGFPRDSIITACSDAVTYNTNQLPPITTSSLPDITDTIPGQNLQEIYNTFLPISTGSDPQKAYIFGRPPDTISTAFFCQQQPHTTSSISPTDSISTGTSPNQVYPTTSVSPTNTILTGSGPEQVCSTSSISPTDTVSTGSGPEEARPTSSISPTDTVSTGSGPKQARPTSSISSTDTVLTGSGPEEARSTSSISPIDTISTGSGPKQARPTSSISPTDTVSTGSGPEEARPTSSISPTDTVSTGSGPEEAHPTSSISPTDTASTGSGPKQTHPTSSISSTDTVLTGSGPEEACSTSSISPIDTISTGSGPKQVRPTSSIFSTDTVSTGPAPEQAWPASSSYLSNRYHFDMFWSPTA